MKYVSLMLASVSVIMCLVMAFYLSLTDLMIERLYDTKRLILILILFAYAIFRTFRIYKMYNQIKKS